MVNLVDGFSMHDEKITNYVQLLYAVDLYTVKMAIMYIETYIQWDTPHFSTARYKKIAAEK